MWDKYKNMILKTWRQEKYNLWSYLAWLVVFSGMWTMNMTRSVLWCVNVTRDVRWCVNMTCSVCWCVNVTHGVRWCVNMTRSVHWCMGVTRSVRWCVNTTRSVPWHVNASFRQTTTTRTMRGMTCWTRRTAAAAAATRPPARTTTGSTSPNWASRRSTATLRRALTRGDTHPWGHSPAGTLTRGDTHPQGHSPTGTLTHGDTHPWGHSPTGTLAHGDTRSRGHSPTGTLTRGDTRPRGHSTGTFTGILTGALHTCIIFYIPCSCHCIVNVSHCWDVLLCCRLRIDGCGAVKVSALKRDWWPTTPTHPPIRRR